MKADKKAASCGVAVLFWWCLVEGLIVKACRLLQLLRSAMSICDGHGIQSLPRKLVIQKAIKLFSPRWGSLKSVQIVLEDD